MKSKQKLMHVIQLCGRKKGMFYITVVKIRGVKSRTSAGELEGLLDLG